MLAAYGFTLPKNQFKDTVSLDRHSSAKDLKSGFDFTLKINSDFNGKYVEQTIHLLRLSFLDAEERKNYDTYLERIDFNNELKALQELNRLCLARLDDYPRTLDGDKVLFEREDLTYNQRNSLKVTIHEKEVLHSIVDFTNKVIDVFLAKTPDEFLEKRIKKARKDGTSKELLNYYK